MRSTARLDTSKAESFCILIQVLKYEENCLLTWGEKKLVNISDNLENLTMKITIKLAKNVTQFYTFTLWLDLA